MTGLTLLWACNPFRGNISHWQVSQEAGQITQDTEKLYTKRQKDPGKTNEEISG
jgi:hypothetical protein